MNHVRTIALMMAAGKGSRMKADKNKVYLELCGKPVLYYSLLAYEKSRVDEIILVVTPGDEEYVRKEIVERYGFRKVGKIVPGGSERFESVSLGIRSCPDRGEAYLLIHDGARPFIRPDQIDLCIEETGKYKACAMAMPVKDTIRIVDEEGFSLSTPDRKTLWLMQTPQCCLLSEARVAYKRMMDAWDGDITDDVMVLERYIGRHSRMIRGSYDNIKLTTPEDMVIGETILNKYLGDKQ